ncbi:MAG: winged helix-turn-helix domain-containing protein [Solirubrobacterales bacterium]
MARERESKRAVNDQRRELVDQRVIKALAHPIRVLALAILNERIASPNEIAQELEQSVGHVSYHITVLKKCECIEMVDTVPRRGAVEHYYRATSRAFIDAEAWRRLPASVRPSLTATLLQDLFEDAGAALSAGTFDAREDRHLAWTPMIVDEEGWNEVNKAAAALLERVFEVQAASAERLTQAGEPGVQISVASLVYETPANKERRPTPKKD